MPIETDTDRLAFLDVDEFAVTATYTPVAGGTAVSVLGIFDNDFLQVDGGESAVATRAPRFHCRESDLSLQGRQGDTLVIGGVTYKVATPHSDGQGMTTLWLEKQ